MTEEAALRRPAALRLFGLAFVALWLIVAAFPFLWDAVGLLQGSGRFLLALGLGQCAQRHPYPRRDRELLHRGGLPRGLGGQRVLARGPEHRRCYALGGRHLARLRHPRRLRPLAFHLPLRLLDPHPRPCLPCHAAYHAGLGLPPALLPAQHLGYLPTAIVVLVAINQPFTLWMLHSFFLGIPKDLDESAMVDGCSRFQAFRLVIIPVMWPGVVTTGLFSFLLAYNDFAVTALILSQENQTMVPKISSFLGTTQVQGNVMFAVAAVVSATAPLFVLVLFFQRQIVSGLTAGAVKG